MGNAMRTRTFVAQDMAIEFPHRRFQMGGRAIDLANGNPPYSVGAAVNVEKPIGEWNRIDLYVVGNRAIHVVNGVAVMELTDISELDGNGRRVPLTKGRIQLQAEGATTWFRNIRVEPIRALPRLVRVSEALRAARPLGGGGVRDPARPGLRRCLCRSGADLRVARASRDLAGQERARARALQQQRSRQRAVGWRNAARPLPICADRRR